jgi:hypothetical protein
MEQANGTANVDDLLNVYQYWKSFDLNKLQVNTKTIYMNNMCVHKKWPILSAKLDILVYILDRSE